MTYADARLQAGDIAKLGEMPVTERVRSAEEASGGVPGEPSGEELRGATRFALLIRPAKLICGPFEYPCVMRDVSETGLSVRLFHPLPEQQPIAVEMLSGGQYPIELVWQEGLAAGFRFLDPVDLNEILANAGPYPNRPIRLNMEIPVVLEHGSRKTQITLLNLSQQGARLSSSEYLALGQLVVLQSDCLPRLHAKVRWRNGDQYGVVFEETFKLGELSALAVRIHSSCAFLNAHGVNSSAA